MKKIKILGVLLITSITLISFKSYVHANQRFHGAVISGSIGGITSTESLNKDDETYIMNMCLSKRKDGFDINSVDAHILGTPTNTIGLHTYNELDFISPKGHDFYIWLGDENSYIQNEEDDMIYPLTKDEKQFLIDSYLEYHTLEEVQTMISTKY